MEFRGGTGIAELDERIRASFGNFATIHFKNDGPFTLRTDGRLVRTHDESGNLLPGFMPIPGGWEWRVPPELQRRYFELTVEISSPTFSTDAIPVGSGGDVESAIADAEARIKQPEYEWLRKAIQQLASS